jgi:sirohydrochlorin ferrochelatase
MYVLLAHGSSHANHAAQVNMLAKQVSALLGEDVGTAFLSDATLPNDATVLPLFLGQGKHLTQDVPQLLTASNAIMLPALTDAADDIAKLLLDQLTKESKRIHVVFTVYQFTGFTNIVAALYQHAKGCSLAAISALHGAPDIQSVLQNMKQQGSKKVVLQPVLLFDGHSVDTCKTTADTIDMDIEVMPPLVEMEGFAALIADRLKQQTIETG